LTGSDCWCAAIKRSLQGQGPVTGAPGKWLRNTRVRTASTEVQQILREDFAELRFAFNLFGEGPSGRFRATVYASARQDRHKTTSGPNAHADTA